MKTLSVSLYNRPVYTERLLKALDECTGIDEYKIIICCEPGFKEVEQLASKFRPSQTELTINTRKLGCNTNIFQCLAMGFSVSDYHIHFEDDTIPGKDCLNYFEWASDKYINDQYIFTVCGYVNSNNITEHYYPKNTDVGKVSRRNWFTPWGWATWKDRFDDMRNIWDFQGVNGSWDATINHIARNNRNEIFPTVSRIQNIGGELGTHVPSNDWHKENHYNEYWIESIKKYKESFNEV